jgi:hypothetical protein
VLCCAACHAQAVALFNGNDVFSANVTITFADVPKRGWTSGTQLDVRDMWEKKDMVSHPY